MDGISFNVQQGEILGLLGPNGAGKTTTLRMLTGFLKPTSGSIHVGDFSIEDHALEIKKVLGYLPESAPLYHDMLVYDYLRFVAAMRGMDAPAAGGPHPRDRRPVRHRGRSCTSRSAISQRASNSASGWPTR